MAFRDLFKSLLAQQYAGAGFSGFGGNMPSQQSLDNMNMAKANGGGGGGGMKINPLQVAKKRGPENGRGSNRPPIPRGTLSNERHPVGGREGWDKAGQ